MNNKGWYRVGRDVTQAAARLLLRMDVVRSGPLLAGPKIIAPNHPTTIDPFLVPAYMNERVHILVTESAFKVPGFGASLRAAGHIPVFAGEGKRAFEAALHLLCEGHNVAIFPEGALSPVDGGLHRAHTGVARLALLSGAAVIPLGIGLEPSRIRFLNTGIVNAAGEPEATRSWRGSGACRRSAANGFTRPTCCARRASFQRYEAMRRRDGTTKTASAPQQLAQGEVESVEMNKA